jgi:uncharacterized membrane protein (DUF485 family)
MATFSGKFLVSVTVLLFFFVMFIMIANVAQNSASLPVPQKNEITGVIVMTVIGLFLMIWIVYYEYSTDNGASNAVTNQTNKLTDKLSNFKLF